MFQFYKNKVKKWNKKFKYLKAMRYPTTSPVKSDNYIPKIKVNRPNSTKGYHFDVISIGRQHKFLLPLGSK